MGKMFKALEKAERERYGKLVAEQETPPIEEPLTGSEPLMANKTLNEGLVSYLEPAALASEQFRKLRVNLRNIRFPEAPSTILVTSAKEFEGKTTVSANLAITIAQEINSHALLIEADIRKPVLKDWFGSGSTLGLSDYLSGEIDLSSVIEHTPIPKLSMIACGELKDNPVELIGSTKMENLIHELKHRYPDRYIIIDSSPLLATTEPNVMIKWVDAVLLVIKAGETSREEVREAIGHLKKEKIIGIVLNYLRFNVSTLHSKYFGSAGSYHRYAYGQNLQDSDREKKIFGFIRKKNGSKSHDLQNL